MDKILSKVKNPLEAPVKELEKQVVKVKNELEKVPSKVVHIGDHISDVGLKDFSENFRGLEFDNVGDFIDNVLQKFINEIAQFAFGFDLNCIGCCVTCVVHKAEEEAQQEFVKLVHELQALGLAAKEQFEKFSGHFITAIKEFKTVIDDHIHEIVDDFNASLKSLPGFVKGEVEKMENLLKSIPNIKGPDDVEKLVFDLDAVADTVREEIKVLIKPMKTLIDLFAQFVAIILKLLAEEIKEIANVLIDALKKVHHFVQSMGDKAQKIMSPPGLLTFFLKIDKVKLKLLKEKLGEVQKGLDLEQLIALIEKIMTFLSGKGGAIEKAEQVNKGMREGVKHCDNLVKEMEEIDKIVEVLKKEIHLLNTGIHGVENAAKGAVNEVKKIGGAFKKIGGMFGHKHKKN